MRIPAQMGFLSRKQKTVEPPSRPSSSSPADEPVEEFDVQIPTQREEAAGSPTPPEPDDVEIVVSTNPTAPAAEVSREPRTADARRARDRGSPRSRPGCAPRT